jgi:predicted GNAT family acetyltransferase
MLCGSPHPVSQAKQRKNGAGMATYEDVHDNKELKRFELEVEGRTAFANYELTNETIIFTHTESPPPLAGRGIATALIRGALEQVRSRNLKVVAQCSFVDAFFKRYPKYADLLKA